MTDFLKMAREVGLNPQGAADQTRLTNAMAKAHSAGHTAGYKLAFDLTAAQIEERNAAGFKPEGEADEYRDAWEGLQPDFDHPWNPVTMRIAGYDTAFEQTVTPEQVRRILVMLSSEDYI